MKRHVLVKWYIHSTGTKYGFGVWKPHNDNNSTKISKESVVDDFACFTSSNKLPMEQLEGLNANKSIKWKMTAKEKKLMTPKRGRASENDECLEECLTDVGDNEQQAIGISKLTSAHSSVGTRRHKKQRPDKHNRDTDSFHLNLNKSNLLHRDERKEDELSEDM